ncbi:MULTISPECIES: NUDIX domain-containing protein [unclassified Sinorhizobium]|uniref:NUDIX domain-containing protein n=1 Tax=unclassified Sinorhizobium TaxID=2613772 RepID=UPI0024C316FA|nr:MULTISPECIES: NUDIX domain-containing protein [unclassified Sinorhizobium]MDK1377908.1 NUDIX domain-containing protein [Sinorhizobium sp. 6-70]MDK1480468.1 NUDIX domain-containing protein [Sinorhizobium sp. 6-117]
MPKRSAGILLYQYDGEALRVLLVHPGGPFWSNRDAGAWSIPKGEYDSDEQPEAAARREFLEETGIAMNGALELLGELRQKGGKLVTAFAGESDVDITDIRSNMFEMEWPPRSGKTQAFPEVDRAGWFSLPEAREKINASQRPFLDHLETLRSNAPPLPE